MAAPAITTSPHLNAISPLLTGPKARTVWRVLLVLLLCAISYLALTPAPPRDMDTGWDKANHFLAFASLAFSGHWSAAARRTRYLLLPAALVAYGGAVEVIQMFVPHRSSEWGDLLADSIGIALGLAAALLVLQLLPKTRR